MDEPKRHHYIPRFILKNFVSEKDGLFWYWDTTQKKLGRRNTKNVFMNFHMYRDDTLENPVQIESELSKFETEIAKMVKDKLLSKNEIILSRKELESLRIFLFLLSFRSDSRMAQYRDKKFNESTKTFLSLVQEDENFIGLWKKEVEAIAKCRTYEDVNNSDEIDEIIKLDIENSINGYFMTLVDARGAQFLITDVYPTTEIFPIVPNETKIDLHDFFPISPTRAIVLNHICFKNSNDPLFHNLCMYSKIKDNLVEEPRPHYVKRGIHSKEDTFSYKPRKIYKNDVNYINELFLNECRIGVAFNKIDGIKSSVENFNEISGTKQKHLELLAELNNKKENE